MEHNRLDKFLEYQEHLDNVPNSIKDCLCSI